MGAGHACRDRELATPLQHRASAWIVGLQTAGAEVFIPAFAAQRPTMRQHTSWTRRWGPITDYNLYGLTDTLISPLLTVTVVPAGKPVVYGGGTALPFAVTVVVVLPFTVDLTTLVVFPLTVTVVVAVAMFPVVLPIVCELVACTFEPF